MTNPSVNANTAVGARRSGQQVGQSITRVGAAAVAAMILLAVSGCTTSERPAAVATPSAAPTAPEATDEPIVVDSGEETTQAAPEEETPATAKLGDTVSVANWDVKVVKVELNADAIIAKANMFNDDPKHQYLLVTYQATYRGNERIGNAFWDLTWSFTDARQQVHDEASEVTPADDESWPEEARKGGTIKLQALFDIKPELVSGGLLTVESDDDDFNTVYADFVIE